MATKIKMPSVGQTTDEAMITRWLKKTGDPVAKGDVLLEVETDKSVLEVESYAEGVLLATYFEEGTYASTGDVVALIGKPEELDAESSIPMSNAMISPESSHSAADDEYQPIIRKVPKDIENAKDNASRDMLLEEADLHGDSSDGQILASPKARCTAKTLSVTLGIVKKAFPGEVLKHRHIASYAASYHERVLSEERSQLSGNLHASEQEKPLTQWNTADSQKMQPWSEWEDLPISPMRKAIAYRMMESVSLSPQFQVTMDIDMTEIVRLRKQLNERLENEQIKVTYNDIIIHLASRVLLKHPCIFGTYFGDRIRHYRHVNFGLAVGLNDGLLVPVIREADRKTLKDIAVENNENITSAKSGRIKGELLSGGMITLSNLGAYGVRDFTAILNYPESAILAVGSIYEKAVVVNGSVVVRDIMSLTATFDHRIIDGAAGAIFLKDLKEVLETPLLILVY